MSAIRDSLKGHGERILVLNDETHHVSNESQATAKKWKEFLLSPDYSFRMVVGVALYSIMHVTKFFYKSCSFRREHRKFLHEARCRQQ